jgi:hypothetical protein
MDSFYPHSHLTASAIRGESLRVFGPGCAAKIKVPIIYGRFQILRIMVFVEKLILCGNYVQSVARIYSV